MSHSRSRMPHPPAGFGRADGHVQGAILSVLSFALLFALEAKMMAGLGLPIFATVALCVGGMLAALAWLRHANRASDRLSLWDMAGICLLVGFAALIFGQPEQVVGLTAP